MPIKSINICQLLFTFWHRPAIKISKNAFTFYKWQTNRLLSRTEIIYVNQHMFFRSHWLWGNSFFRFCLRLGFFYTHICIYIIKGPKNQNKINIYRKRVCECRTKTKFKFKLCPVEICANVAICVAVAAGPVWGCSCVAGVAAAAGDVMLLLPSYFRYAPPAPPL